MIISLVLGIVVPCWGDEAREVFRIRVENKDGGHVQVSLDEGKTYTNVGTVRRRAVTTSISFPAASYTPNSMVAAVAVHGIRINVASQDGAGLRRPKMISLVPLEFAEIPQGYGGHIPNSSGIYTDIPAGTGIFRDFAPFVGSQVKLERNSGHEYLSEGWKPSDRDVLLIIVRMPYRKLRELRFDNREDGTVTATYADGETERIATVVRPVTGVGRFDGTSYTGPGLINTNHGGVITVSTAPISTSKLPEGKGPERRGGFQIQPSEHAKTQYPMPQAMIIKPVDGSSDLEGRAPLFMGCIGLAYDPENPRNSVRMEAEVGGEWRRMPEIVGKKDNALSELGITALRILIPDYDQEFLARALRRCSSESKCF